MLEQFITAKKATRALTLISDAQRDEILLAVADAIKANKSKLLEANEDDLSRMDKSNPIYDRLMLTQKRLEDIANDMRHVAQLPSPLGKTLKEKTLENGLYLRRISVPFGVIGIVYESRPNVTFDVFSLCLKSGNVCVLKGSKDADSSNRAIIALIHQVLADKGIDTGIVQLLPATHEAAGEMLNAVGYVDVCIPRGSRRLIDFVRDNAKIPVIETGAGVVHAYFDKDGDMEKGKRIINNAKTRRVSVCNALDCLIIHKDRIADLPELVAPLAASNVKIYADQASQSILSNSDYPQELVEQAREHHYGTEFMDYAMAIRTVGSLDEAIEHITENGSGHSECIITENKDAAQTFEKQVDAACVYVNAPTSFTDGAQFGLGAEIGISTQKLGPRGPMALEEMTTYKWLIEGNG
ncbi:MAG: glutamate-5-semialdehyde dehydrogenase, partial [Prevotella sp.]|nr:glutamate-5-semialdehyde dehydrogenase [Prevotella sp.]